MKQIFRIFTLIAVAMLTAGQAWADGEADLGFINIGTVSGGMPMFYKEATCEHRIYTNSNLSSSDLTDGKVYIKATPDWNYTGSRVTITAQVSTSSSPAEARSITRGSTAPGVAVGDFIDVTATDTKGVYQITMPTDGKNVTVSATFKEKPYLGDGTNAHISYYSYDAQGNRVTSNTGDDGHPRVYILDGTEASLGQNGTDPATSKPYETWYVCNTTDLSYTSTLILNGDVHLILADNAKMTMDVNDPAIFGHSGDFYIYGQSDNSGKLIATSSRAACFYLANELYVNGGQVEAKMEANRSASSNFGINCNGATINGGQLKATGSIGIEVNDALNVTGGQVEASGTDGHGIVAYNVTISGGQVTATGSDTNYGIISGDIVLGWTNANDYIKASKYRGIVKTAAGQRFVAYNMTSETDISATTIVSGSIANNNFTLADIDGQKLKPLDGYTVTVADGISVGTLSGTTFTAADPDFTITTGAGTESEVTPYYIYKASTQEAPVTVTLKATDTNKQLGSVTITGADAQDNGDGTFTFTMGTSDVTVTAATFKVSYFDPTVEGDDKTKTATNVTALTSDMSLIGQSGQETWYVVDGDVTIDQELTVSGDVNLILADGKELSVNASDGTCGILISDNSSLTIYTQSHGEDKGKMTLTAGTGLRVGNGSLTINGGLIYVTSTGTRQPAIDVDTNGSMTLNNGDVITKAGSDYSVTVNEGSGSGGVIDIPGGGDSFSVVNLTYNRTLTAPTESDNDATIGGKFAKLYTVCLPTAPTKIDNVKYYTLASVSGTTLNFEEVTTLAEDTPYLMAVIGSSDIPESVTVKNETLTLKKIVTGTTVDGYTMMGTQTGLSNANAISAAGDGKFTYILQHGAKWGQVKDDTDAHKAAYIPPFRAFIIGPAVPSNGNARELDSTFEDDATGIQNIVTVDRDGTERWYDLNGRRIDQPTKKGIYINNGKKVIKK